MSSLFVRQSIKDFIAAELSSEKLVDLTAEFEELTDFLSESGVGDKEVWLGIQFLGSEERAVDVRGSNSRGKYRETGILYLHVVDVAKLGVHNAILTRAEAIRDKFRGQRINGTILIESVAPTNFGDGVSLNFEAGYTAGTLQIDYQRDLDL